MRLSAYRLAFCSAALAVTGLVGSAHSATTTRTGPSTLKYKDAVGDARGGQADTDIVGVTFTTTGETVIKKVGRKTIKTYTPERLVAQMTLSAPPSAVPYLTYSIDAESNACGILRLYYYGSGLSGGGFFLDCGTPEAGTGFDSLSWDEPKVKGKTITWSIAWSKLPRELTSKASIDLIHAYTAVSEPFTGLGPAFSTYSADLDDAVTDSTYKIG